MSTELAMNAYVLLGNALNYMANGVGLPPESGFDAESVRGLYSKIEPLPPDRIIEAIAALSTREKDLLGGLCRYVLMQATPSQAESILGLPAAEIEETLSQLGL